MGMAHQPTLRKPGDGRNVVVVGDVKWNEAHPTYSLEAAKRCGR
jgi:hypothetical protein